MLHYSEDRLVRQDGLDEGESLMQIRHRYLSISLLFSLDIGTGKTVKRNKPEFLIHMF